MKFVIALKALMDSNGDVSRAKAATSIRISARTWQKAIDQFRQGWQNVDHLVFDQITAPKR